MPDQHPYQPTQDIAKAMGMLAIVYGHVWRGLAKVMILATNHPLRLVDYAIYAWHMPLFFLLAGYNAAFSLQRTEPKTFILRRARILVPVYFLWSALQVGLQIARNHSAALLAGGQPNGYQLTLADLFSIPYKPVDQYWFLYALMLYHVVAALMHRRLALLGVLAAGAFLLNPYADTLFRQELLYHAIFYVGGLLIAQKTLPSLGNRNMLITGLACFAAYLGLTSFGWTQHLETTNPFMLPATCTALGAVMIGAHALANTRLKATLIYVGSASLAIYVMHVFFTAGCRTLLLKLGIDATVTQLVAGTIIGMIGPLVVYALLKRFRLQHYVFL